jgi:hypothetical protein
MRKTREKIIMFKVERRRIRRRMKSGKKEDRREELKGGGYKDRH